MHKLLSYFISIALGILPQNVRSFGRKFKLNKAFDNLLTKYDGEMLYQKSKVTEFKNDKKKYLYHWKNLYDIDGLVKFTKTNSKSRVLDVGCGIASVLNFLPGIKYGIDPLANQYKKIYTYPKEFKIIQGYGENLPFADSFFNIVFCSNALDHTDNPKQVVKEIYRVLNYTGYFVCTVDIFPARTKRDNTHPYSFTNKDVHLLLKKHFHILRKKNVDSGFAGESNKSLLIVCQK